MSKINKKGEVRTWSKVVAQPAVTSEKGVANTVRSGSGSGDESVDENLFQKFFLFKNHQNGNDNFHGMNLWILCASKADVNPIVDAIFNTI